MDAFLEMHATPAEEIVIDLDATDDPVPGEQEGGYYRRYCFLPLYITCGNQVLAVRVRRSKIDSAKGALAELKRVVERIRGPLAGVRITVRGNSGFCRDRIMAWCEGEEGILYVFGLARNPQLQRRIWRRPRRHVPRAERPRAASGSCATGRWTAGVARGGRWARRSGCRGQVVPTRDSLSPTSSPKSPRRGFSMRTEESTRYERSASTATRSLQGGRHASESTLIGIELERAQAGTIRGKLLKITGSIHPVTDSGPAADVAAI